MRVEPGPSSLQSACHYSLPQTVQDASLHALGSAAGGMGSVELCIIIAKALIPETICPLPNLYLRESLLSMIRVDPLTQYPDGCLTKAPPSCLSTKSQGLTGLCSQL